MSKITLHAHEMPTMDATHYWAEVEEDTTVQDLIEFINEEYPNGHGEIDFDDDDLPTLRFNNGTVDTIDGDWSEYPILDIKLTQYHRDGKLLFDVILSV